jgi:hypothetical protein
MKKKSSSINELLAEVYKTAKEVRAKRKSVPSGIAAIPKDKKNKKKKKKKEEKPCPGSKIKSKGKGLGKGKGKGKGPLGVPFKFKKASKGTILAFLEGFFKEGLAPLGIPMPGQEEQATAFSPAEQPQSLGQTPGAEAAANESIFGMQEGAGVGPMGAEEGMGMPPGEGVSDYPASMAAIDEIIKAQTV